MLPKKSKGRSNQNHHPRIEKSVAMMLTVQKEEERMGNLRQSKERMKKPGPKEEWATTKNKNGGNTLMVRNP